MSDSDHPLIAHSPHFWLKEKLSPSPCHFAIFSFSFFCCFSPLVFAVSPFFLFCFCFLPLVFALLCCFLPLFTSTFKFYFPLVFFALFLFLSLLPSFCFFFSLSLASPSLCYMHPPTTPPACCCPRFVFPIV